MKATLDMHKHYARKLGPSRLYRSERRKVYSYIVPYIVLLMLLIFGYYIYDSIIRNNTKQGRLTKPLGKTSQYQRVQFHTRTLLNSSDGQYPEDVFTQDQRRHGAVLLHILGLCYVFLAVALACDEFFVPALEVIIERLKISEDVAGATFMAAGGSAPELFISLFGTFADPDSNVGIGTIVGSAVFNVLFVIGMCAVFSRRVLTLTWWPLFRDCIFYSIAILLLIVFFLDGVIYWYEALILFIMYLLYVLFMKFNHTLERIVKNLLRSNKVSKVDALKDPESNDNPGVKTEHYLEKAMEYLSSNNKSTTEKPCFHYGALQLVVNTIDPLWDASLAVRVKHFKQISKSKNKEPKHSTIDLQKRSSENSNQLSFNTTTNGTIQTDCNSTTTRDRGQSLQNYEDKDLGAGTSISELMTTTVEIVPHNQLATAESPIPGMYLENNNERKTSTESRLSTTMIGTASSQKELVDEDDDIDDIEDTQPIDLSWPSGWRDRLVYIIKAPLMFLMYYTMVDVRRPERVKYYPWTFFMSTVWIGGYSYLLVWWAKIAGDTFGIPTSVMGLTFLAAGTSIPDLITSVLVARKGFGDMAVSSSIGSNMFDITVGLPLPWMAYCAINVVKSITVSSDGLFCSVIMLFLMLISVITTIALSKWQLSKLLGATMFVLYIVFILLSLLLQFNIISCIKLT